MTDAHRDKLVQGIGYLRGLSFSQRALDEYDRKFMKELATTLEEIVRGDDVLSGVRPEGR